ncbi:hypothetical protein EHEL_020150 [Encephalitozoon hellem ATCC 50504]|uniref:Transmembrane protein n=1 Tax=Encephalitozoon hellem TaxID=27973 RepID=A0A9Q9C1V0_ENCHE|nr:uncharacterized protein EHEL_020150 [Encephalitozoon hellem ATCC 50504]AFM97772.1 hypothetical protein EHEL_020150 [Encephalitozoon hellem ATCC 50504]UTX42541.1 hypothetical protein GPU96_02g02510 [Encephalitozoon hellem]WEL37996.1 hypothetical protein PFJ87_02g00320 [Encephalitozoon hellem]|eukprot:XP_003886753.1 hypothetical protein EHEL_020150 [Encephalitozoon hellem ATCC 50504]
MRNKPGLLPKWLFIYTMAKTAYILVAHKDYLNIISPWNPGSAYTYLAFLLGISRLLASRNATKIGFYSAIAGSFLAEGVFFIYSGFQGVYPIQRVIVETFLALFTVGWMIFLYPYYLLEDSESREKLKDKSAKHQ